MCAVHDTTDDHAIFWLTVFAGLAVSVFVFAVVGRFAP
jgi:hypothetical protein